MRGWLKIFHFEKYLIIIRFKTPFAIIESLNLLLMQKIKSDQSDWSNILYYEALTLQVITQFLFIIINYLVSGFYRVITLMFFYTDCYCGLCFHKIVFYFISTDIILWLFARGHMKVNISLRIYLLYRYWQLRIESTQPILSIAFRANIPNTKSQTGNILGVSRFESAEK